MSNLLYLSESRVKRIKEFHELITYQFVNWEIKKYHNRNLTLLGYSTYSAYFIKYPFTSLKNYFIGIVILYANNFPYK
jgi:hypothetical protein